MKISFDFDPEEETGITIPKDKRSEALAECADFIKESMLSSIGEGMSPVAGEGKFPALSKEYKKRKEKISSNAIPNLELYGDMLDAVEVVPVKKIIRVSVDASQQDKADGHCNFSGKSKLPRRRFIPDGEDGQTFTRDIVAGVRSILETYSED